MSTAAYSYSVAMANGQKISILIGCTGARLEYIMLLKFPIILSGISFYFNLLFPKLFLTKTTLLPSICVFSIQNYNILYLWSIKHTINSLREFIWRPSAANNVVMDTNNISLWVLVYVSVKMSKRFAFILYQSTLENLKVSF